MRIVTAEEIDAVLRFPALIEALRIGFARGAKAPMRHHHALSDAPGAPMHLMMPAWSMDAPAPGSFLGTKLVNVFPRNAEAGLPAVLGAYVLQAGDTGAILAVMDGTRLTHWRTAATSALAADLLARSESRRMVMVGTGALAPFLIRAHAAVRPLEHIAVWGRRREAAAAVVAALPDLPVTVADDLAAAVGQADVISCATLATAPLVRGAWVQPGTHVDLVGAFAMGMREADDELLRRARLFIDTEAALTEGGDIAVAIAAGVLTPRDVRAGLQTLCRSQHPGRDNQDEVTVFKSVGTALEDLVAAELVWEIVKNAASGR